MQLWTRACSRAARPKGIRFSLISEHHKALQGFSGLEAEAMMH